MNMLQKDVEGNWGHKIKLRQQPLPISIATFPRISRIPASPKILLENYLPRHEGTGKTWKSMEMRHPF